MLIARAPLRLSFAGGGTDLEAYYRQYGGMVISATIDKYVYVFLKPNVNGAIQISSSDHGVFSAFREEPGVRRSGESELARAILHHFGIRDGLSIFLTSELPFETGLGSASAVGVSLIKAISTVFGERLSRSEVAELAWGIEIKKLGWAIGKQDPYATAFGGLNVIWFRESGVEVQPLNVSEETLDRLQRNLMLFFTGLPGVFSAVPRQPGRLSADANPKVLRTLHTIKDITLRLHDCLLQGDLDRFGGLLDESWQQRKRIASGASHAVIDDYIETAREHGARGGKVTGAGGGFLMLYCDEGRQADVRRALEEKGLHQMDVHFDSEGARVLMNSILSIPHFQIVPAPDLSRA